MNKKKIIITWWAWFIGSFFLNKYVLLNKDIDFINIDLLTYAWKLDNINTEVKNSSNYFFEKVDITDFEKLKEIFNKYKPTDIIHFAAESHVDNSIENPFSFTKTNIIWTQNLLDCHRIFWLNKFHQISTDEVYWDLQKDEKSFTEENKINPSNPYSASKAWADMLVKSYNRTFGIYTIITRCSNNYWPNQDDEKLIPRFIKLLKEDKKVTIHWDWKNIRDWLYVEDHCDAIWLAFNKAKSWSIYNIWWNNEYNILEMTEIILKILWKDKSYISFVEDRKWQDKRYAMDATKIKNELWWYPKTDFKKWIIETINHYIK